MGEVISQHYIEATYWLICFSCCQLGQGRPERHSRTCNRDQAATSNDLVVEPAAEAMRFSNTNRDLNKTGHIA